jgi:hypothetical protein
MCAPLSATLVSKLSGEGFFPHYAGFSEGFANALLSSAKLTEDALICDP